MKRMMAILLILALMTGCAADSADLMDGITANEVDTVADLDENRAAVTDFGLRLFQASMEEGENTLISPLSVLYALAMTANGAEGETLAQMEAVFGLDLETLNAWLHSYRASLPNGETYTLTLANSIWFRDTQTLRVEEDFLQTNADYYGSSIYRAAFDDSTVQEINAWVKKNTDGMISRIINEIPQDAMLYLINALTFDAEWQNIYDDIQIRAGEFTTEDSRLQEVEMMHGTENKYIEDENATGFIKYYADRKYAFAALLPDEGITVAEYVASLTGEHLAELLAEPKDIMVETRIPKFKTEYSLEMNEILKSMGMTDAFDGAKANLTKMGTSDLGNLYIGQVLHKTFIAVDERGTKAGAVTSVRMDNESAAAVPDKIQCVYLERPFVYLLIDCETGLPFFIGTMMDVTGGGVDLTTPDHTHTLAPEPQTVEDPVEGYCGNMMTTVYLNEKEYTFMDSESVALTDILINLRYDPEKVCKCLPEFTVKTEDGTQYGVSVTEGYVRCDDGQAELTKEQVATIQEVLSWLESGG